jgi:hypothetical protein
MKETLSSQVDVVADIHAADIRWMCEPILRLENVGVAVLLALDLDALYQHVADLREALCSVRTLAHQALAEVAERNRELAAARQRQADLVEENRRYVQNVMLGSVKKRPRPRIT